MSKRFREVLGTVIGLVLFGAALFVLYRALRGYQYHDVMAQIRSISGFRILLALVFTVLSYGALTLYDRLALYHLGRSISYPRVAFTSFTTYSISHNIGFAFFTGSSIRFRLYTALGLSVPEIAQVIGFAVLTFWLGYLTTAMGAFLLSPLGIPSQLNLPFQSTRALGLAIGVVLLGYFGTNLIYRRQFSIRGHEIRLPAPIVTILQVLVGVFDWLVAAAALWIILPEIPGISYHHILGIYLIAQIAGLTSSIPGGLGVFESVFVLILSPVSSSAAILGSLLVYRLVYYLIPLGAGAAMLGGYELSLRRQLLLRPMSVVSQWARMIAPYFFSVTTFLGGMVLLVSGATPSIHGRMAWLNRFLPLPVIELSHFLGSLVGVALLLLAKGLQRRLRSAWGLTSILLVSGMVFSLVKGLDYEEAAILGVMLAILLPSRSAFYRKSSLTQDAFSPAWTFAILTATVSVVWLTAFSYKQAGFSTDLWWHFVLFADAPRSWRAATGVLAFLAIISAVRLFRAHRPTSSAATETELEACAPVVAGSSCTIANLVYLGDKMVLINETGDAFIMYSVKGRSWVAMGDPIGSKDSAQELVWQFHELANRHGGWTAFYQVLPDMFPIYLEIGLSFLKLGEEARVNLVSFSLEGSANKPLRHEHRRPESAGCTFRVVPATEVEPILPELKEISDDWLTQKNTREKRFSIGFFHAPYLRKNPIALIEQKERKIGFANLWLGPDREELSFDLMRYCTDAPSGVMDFLIIELILWGKQQGYGWLNLGMAPLSGLGTRTAAPLWNQLAALIFRHGEHFYNFQGLRQYKEKFRPEWRPRYLASPGGMAQYRILADISSLVGGSVKGVVTK
jgi:phosphatidylglycerol lysyltransferase